MNCPICDDVKMREVEKEGILIDICPSCKGVWLDRGELDKLMAGVREVREPFNQWYDRQEPQPERRTGYEERPPAYSEPQYYDKHHPKYKRKKNVMDIFGDLFD
ncbi:MULTISPECIES: TFIIB-type zinc ribbon-containing protein [Paenibacillus]|uniref:Zf-TFIIB domain-containing protein n=1 Tax=Paenibacillus oceani TaxID=2772510 RepID=A0A927C8J3_9BACL|nr:zf-TFIIB domain-containing protein [Paenibacillus oceani]MBD2862824.1 zf-TFIIB domain-containing protein [Paenibacillus oceani]MDF2660623.1 hypothetical protein [Paenibacillus sp.]